MRCRTIAITGLASGVMVFAQASAVNDTPATVIGALERVVPGAPFSAELVTEVVQTLADGNHIKQTSTVTVARDSNGRVRHGQSLSPLDPASPKVLTVIRDPIAGVRYVIDPDRQTIRRSGIKSPASTGAIGALQGIGVQEKAMSIASQSLASWVSARTGAALAASPRPEVTSLGTQLIEGVLATGAKAGVAVPPGPVGNEQTLAMTSEIWYSPELSVAVLIRNSDARFEETIVRLRNIRRGDPDSSLFEVPAGYRLLGDGMPGAAPAETRPRR